MASKDLKLNPFVLKLQNDRLTNIQGIVKEVASIVSIIFTGVSAAGLSAISGLNVISEITARKSPAKNAKPITLHELFYNPRKVTDQIFYIPDSEYDPFYDYDFTDYKGDDSNCTRGGYSYKRPAGWNRKAVRVIGKYEDDVWLGQRGWRDGSSEEEWPVSYHGTKRASIHSIVANGYDSTKSKQQLYGEGIYSAPDPKVAEWYTESFIYNGQRYKCLLQNRVNPQGTYSVLSKRGDGVYYVTPNQGDIRPYGLCIKKI